MEREDAVVDVPRAESRNNASRHAWLLFFFLLQEAGDSRASSLLLLLPRNERFQPFLRRSRNSICARLRPPFGFINPDLCLHKRQEFAIRRNQAASSTSLRQFILLPLACVASHSREDFVRLLIVDLLNEPNQV